MRVLIVGAGIAGPTLAYWLLRAGHQPTLVERAPELRRGGYLVDFWGAGFDVAERMGIVPELRRRGLSCSPRRGRSTATGAGSPRSSRPRSWGRPSGTSASPGPIWRRSSTTRSTAGRVDLGRHRRTRSTTTGIGFASRSRAGAPATSIWSWVPTACTHGCAGWPSARTSSSRSTWASWSRRSTSRDTARATNSSP